MKKTNWVILLIFFSFTSCKKNTPSIEHIKHNLPPKLSSQLTIAFGSCNHEDDEQPLWKHIMKEEADLWIWLGDAIYGDTDNMEEFAAKFEMQKNNPDYLKFKSSIEIIGTWDDHDYGSNDVGKEYPFKEKTQQLFLQFIEVADDDPRWDQKGIYHSYDLNKNGIHVKILVLDSRYFRDELVGKSGAYGQNQTGTILGSAQWSWLEGELKKSMADVHVFASSIQFIAEEQGWEKWSNFPSEKDKMLNLLIQLEVANPIFISGDRHAAEISVQNYKDLKLYDITSSGLTSVIKNPKPDFNKYRLSDTDRCLTPNYGLLSFRKKDSLFIQTEIKTSFTTPVMRHNLSK